MRLGYQGRGMFCIFYKVGNCKKKKEIKVIFVSEININQFLALAV